MLKYPDLDPLPQPVSNYNYPPLSDIQPSPAAQPINYPQLPPLNTPGTYPPPTTDYPYGLQRGTVHEILPLNQAQIQGFPSFPMQVCCPNCFQNVQTVIEKNPGCLTVTLSIFCCAVGLFCGCCLIPCCIEDFKVTYHYCPKCSFCIGSNSCLQK